MNCLRMSIGLLLLVLTLPSSAIEPSHLIWAIDGKDVAFVRYEDSRLTISQNCVQAGGYLKCDASRELNSVKLAPPSADQLKGGKNPGSVLCLQIGGSVVFGKSKAGETTFCKFKDGSLIENGSLYAAALRKESA